MGVFGREAKSEGPASPRTGLVECRMGDIVNLRSARKRAKRQLAERKAAAHRLLHGRSKAERELAAKRDAKARRDLDRHRIETGDEG
jgi:hypothetical protein